MTDPAAAPPPRVTVVIPVWNAARWLPDCLSALQWQSFRQFEVVLVDNGSTDGAIEALGSREEPGSRGALGGSESPTGYDFPLEIVSRPTNEGFAAAVNHGIRHSETRSKTQYVALLNADTRAGHEWLEHLVAALDAAPPEVGAAAPCMLQMDDPTLIDNAGDTFSWYGSATKIGHGQPVEKPVTGSTLPGSTLPGEVLSVSAGAALYRRDLFARIGLFDERFESYLEDIDIGLRGRLLGFRYLYVPEARVLHAGHGSELPRGRYVELVTRNRLLVQLKVLPFSGMLRHLHRWLWGQCYFLIVYRQPLSSLRGHLSFLACLPHALRERSRLRSAAVLDDADWNDLLSRDLGEPTLRQLFARRRARRQALRHN